MELEQVQKLVEEVYPGVRLESAVQGWFYLNDYQKGIEAHGVLRTPTAKDDRWLGDCYLLVKKHMEAETVLYRAVTRGEEAARIPLARALNFLGRSTEALNELDRTDLGRLSTADKVLWYRAKSIQIEWQSNLKEAVDLAEEAWRLVQGIPELPVYAHWVLLRLGRLHSQTGRAQRALWFLDRGREHSARHAGGPLYLSFARAETLIALGRYGDALQELNSVSGASAAFDALLLEANAAWAMNEIKRAIELFDRVIEETSESEWGQPELLARLSLVALWGFRGAFETASAHLMRADFLKSSTQDQLNYRFREAVFAYRSHERASLDAAAELEGLAAEFGTMGLLQEQGWVRLHLAAIYRAAGDERWYRQLDLLQGLSVVLQNKAFLAREWVLLPELREAAMLTHPDIAGKPRVVLEVYTLGSEKLVLGGQVVNIRLRRACEVLAYFLEHKEASLKQVLLDVFGDENPKTSRIYFHQFRHELAERVPGLSVEYDSDSKVYRLASKVDVLWDVAELRAGRKMGENGLFLPGSGSEWVAQIDQELEPLRNQPSPLLQLNS